MDSGSSTRLLVWVELDLADAFQPSVQRTGRQLGLQQRQQLVERLRNLGIEQFDDAEAGGVGDALRPIAGPSLARVFVVAAPQHFFSDVVR
jgi:hypothetical protein